MINTKKLNINDSDYIIKYLYLRGKLKNIKKQVLQNSIIMELAHKHDIIVSDEEIQAFADNYRIMNGLFSATDMMAFLEAGNIKLDEFENFCEAMILNYRLKDIIIQEDEIKKYFSENKTHYDFVRISIIKVKDENSMKEIAAKLKEDGEKFHKLARQHSIDESTKYTGGYAGLFSRGYFGPDVETKIFNARKGDIIGPVECDGNYYFILIEDLIRAELNDIIKEQIKESLFSDMIGEHMKNHNRQA